VTCTPSSTRWARRSATAGVLLVHREREQAGCSDEIAKFRAEHWDRVVTRLPGEHRTARWLVRQAAHEGRHHLGDIRTLGNALVEDT